jgi:hypothetical protein
MDDSCPEQPVQYNYQKIHGTGNTFLNMLDPEFTVYVPACTADGEQGESLQIQ